jgi:hypothetical protein
LFRRPTFGGRSNRSFLAKMAATYSAYIEAGKPGAGVTGKFLVGFDWPDPDMGDMPVALNMNVNSDVSLPQFTAKKGKVTITVPNKKEPSGMFRFTGSIGGGKIFMKIPSKAGDIIVKGEIEGGPDQGRTFVATGGFTRG